VTLHLTQSSQNLEWMNVVTRLREFTRRYTTGDFISNLMRKMILRRLLKVLILSAILWFCIHTIVIVIDGLNDELGHCDVAIVLGNKVELDGYPSKRLQSRLDRAVTLYKQKYFEKIIVSGGFGKEGFDEAEVMKDYLVMAGIPNSSIIIDSRGTNTEMTSEITKYIMDTTDLHSAMVITQYYHITRSKLALHQVGIKEVYSAHARFFEIRDIYSIFREFFAYYQYLWFK